MKYILSILVVLGASSCISRSGEEREAEIRYDSDSAKLEVVFQNNVKVEERKYYPNGNVEYRYAYLDSVRHGQYEIFSSSGKLLEDGSFHLGEIDGKRTKYKNGKPELVQVFIKGEIIRSLLYSGESLIGQTNYQNGQYVYSKYWYENGELENTINYLTGVDSGWFKTGKLKHLGFWKDGNEDSLWTFYDQNGKLIRQVQFDQGDTVKVVSWGG